jgi:hypothetical protein
MANENLPIGAIPVNMPYGNVRCRRYTVAVANATDIFIGDPVLLINTGTVIRATGGAGNYLCGFVLGCFDTTGAPLGYLPTITAGYVLVADDPEQQFILQEDGVTTPLALEDVGEGVDLIIGTGSTFRNRSGTMIDSNTVGTGVTTQLRILAKQERVNNDLGAYCKWIVKINCHQLQCGVVGQPI